MVEAIFFRTNPRLTGSVQLKQRFVKDRWYSKPREVTVLMVEVAYEVHSSDAHPNAEPIRIDYFWEEVTVTDLLIEKSIRWLPQAVDDHFIER